MTQLNPSTQTLRSARAFMDEYIIDALELRGNAGIYLGMRGIGFISEEESLYDINNQPFELGEILVNKAGVIMETSPYVYKQMLTVRGFISHVIKPVKIVINETYRNGGNLADPQFRILFD